GGGISLDDDGPDLMDIEVHMNTIDSSMTLPGASAPRTRGGAKRSRVAAIAPAPPVVGEREGLRARNQRRSYPYPSDD
ncbi:unnamed protein product, partial [Laminaria digitata]